MKIAYDCYPCMLKSFINMSRILDIDDDTVGRVLSKVMKYLSTINLNISAPNISKNMQRIIREELNNPDPYKELKKEYNNLIINLDKDIKNIINKSADKFDTLLRLAIGGNIIDFGAIQKFDVIETLNHMLKAELVIDKSKELYEDIKKAETILYLGDNCGEIVLDTYFAEYISKELNPKAKLYYSVRGMPILNDATEDDAYYVGMDKYAKIINTGDNAPGVLYEYLSDEYKEIYNNADVIISKGMGNFESLSDRDENIYFLLIAKCELVADHLGVKKGDPVVVKL